MRPIHEDLRLNNGDKSIHLADLAVVSKGTSIALNGLHGRSTVGVNAEDSTPLSKASTLRIVLCGPLSKSLESLGDSLAVHERGTNTSVDLDSWDDVDGLHNVNERSSIRSILEQGLFVEPM